LDSNGAAMNLSCNSSKIRVSKSSASPSPLYAPLNEPVNRGAETVSENDADVFTVNPDDRNSATYEPDTKRSAVSDVADAGTFVNCEPSPIKNAAVTDSLTMRFPLMKVSTFISSPSGEMDAVAVPLAIRSGSKSIAVAVMFCN
jgi:hypothetical protein